MNNLMQAMRIGSCAIGLAACFALAASAAERTTNNIPQQSLEYKYMTLVPVSSVQGYANIIEWTTNLNDPGSWTVLYSNVVTDANYTYPDDYAPGGDDKPTRYYRVVEIPPVTPPPPTAPAGMVLITNGSFTMGQPGATAGNGPEHTVTLSAFVMDVNLVTYSLWTEVYKWATTHGYTFAHAGAGKGATHPVQMVDWYDAVKWCNARSEMSNLTPCYYTDATKTPDKVYRSGNIDLANNYVNWSANGYRLPTEAEWERAARGGKNGFRFPWAGDTISQKKANYFGNTKNYNYDEGPTSYNPTYRTGSMPYTSPVGSFAPNAYGLYDMAGNVEEWCWDWYSRYYYRDSSGSTDPQGPGRTTYRAVRGGSWQMLAAGNACYARDYKTAKTAVNKIGFRCVRLPE